MASFSGTSASQSTDWRKKQIEIHKENIEIAKRQIAAERQRVAAIKRSRTTHWGPNDKMTSKSLINACKNTIKTQQYYIAKLREEIRRNK